MEFLFEYIKVNTKYAAKNVFLKFKEYIPFFAAIFIIECVFFNIFITTASNARNINEELTSQFDYDVVVSGLTENESKALQNNLYFPALKKDRMFEQFWIKQASEQDGGDYRFYLTMRDGHDYNDLVKAYITPVLGDSDRIVISTSPLYEYRTSSNMLSDSPHFLLLIGMCLISTAAIAAIYSVRLNNQKFMYGIYITFGANLKKLISTAVFEMMLIGILCFIPSALLSYLFATLAYKPFGVFVVFEFGAILKVLLCILVIAVAGVYFPMKITSRKPPIELIVSSDNSNHVISPRASFNLLGKKFPKHYENLSFWRFRRYYATLVLSSVIFTSIFICGFYISGMYELNTSKPIAEYTLNIDPDILDEEERIDDINFIYDRLSAVEGINGVLWNVDRSATEMNSIVLLPNSAKHKAGKLISSTSKADCSDSEMQKVYEEYQDEGLSVVTNAFKYTAFDENMLDYLSRNYEVKGDIYSIVNDPSTVIVSENIYNDRSFKFSVGDKIVLSNQLEVINAFEGDYFDNVSVLDHLVNDTYRDFKVYTVGAVIKDYHDSDGKFTVGMRNDEYTAMTGESYLPTKATVYLDSNVTPERVKEINSEVGLLFRIMGSSYRLHRNYESVVRKIMAEKNETLFSVMLSSLVLIMSPVIWFFSQSSFFSKRKTELYVLRAFGARESEISAMFTRSGGIMSAIGFFVATIMSLPASYIIYMAFNTWLPSLALVKNDVVYKFYISPVALITCALVSAACGFFASMIPYKMSVRQQNKRIKIKNEYKGEEN